MSQTRTGIYIAILLGLMMVTGALLVNKDKQPMHANENTSVATISQRKHIPITDSDADGLPDWQAEFVDPNPIYLDATSSEPYVPPDTVTGRFSTQFFEDVTTLENLGLLEDSQQSLIDTTISELAAQTQERVYTRDDLTDVVTVTNPDGLRAYGNIVAGTIFYYQTDEENELQVFGRLTRDENPKHLEKLAVIEKQYNDIISALLEMEVPERYVFEHLTIVNAFSALKENVVGMQRYFDDPFYTVMRYRRVYADVINMNNTIVSLYDTLYLDEKIRFADNEALPVLVELLQ